MKNYMCNDCSKQFDTTKEMVAHYRKSHPDDAYGLWEAIGTTGDAFADKLVAYYRNSFHEAERGNRSHSENYLEIKTNCLEAINKANVATARAVEAERKLEIIKLVI